MAFNDLTAPNCLDRAETALQSAGNAEKRARNPGTPDDRVPLEWAAMNAYSAYAAAWLRLAEMKHNQVT